MKKFMLILTSLLCFAFIQTYAQTVPWANNPQGLSTDSGNDVAMDDVGNVYVIGNFVSPTLTFTTFTGTEILSNDGGTDIFVARYNGITGLVDWVFLICSDGDDYGNGIVYGDDDFLYICGTFDGVRLVFDSPTTGSLLNPGSGSTAYFIAKIDPSLSPSVIWKTCNDSPDNYTAEAITVDQDYGVFFCGSILNPTSRDIFIGQLKIDDGVLIDSFIPTGDGADSATGIAVNSFGILYVTGYFNSSVITFPIGTMNLLFPSAPPDVFLLQFQVHPTAGFTLNWSKPIGSNGDDIGNSVAVDESGNAYLTGSFVGDNIFLSPAISLENSCLSGDPPFMYMKDYFIVKYSATGDHIWSGGANAMVEEGPYEWLEDFDDEGMDIAVNSVGECFVTGYFKSTYIEFEPLPLLCNSTDNNYAEIFVVKYNVDGTPTWNFSSDHCTEEYSNIPDDFGWGIATAAADDRYAVTGQFYSSCLDFLGSEVSNTDESWNTSDALVFSFGETSPSVCPCVETKVTKWYFGNEAGIEFITDPLTGEITTEALTDGEIHTQEGCSVMHDEEGNLLFYTDGDTVWDRNHNYMPNGIGLKGHSSSTQAALIVPKPCNDSLYYIFTTGYWGSGGDTGLNYSVVNMKLAGGLGDVIVDQKNINLLSASISTEKLTYVPIADPEQDTLWIITHKYGSNGFIAYPLTEDGILDEVISNAGSHHSINNKRKAGYLKASPNGEYLALAVYEVAMGVIGYEIFEFDQSDGSITCLASIDVTYSSDRCYGVEFSLESRYLYFSDFHDIWQYDLSLVSDPVLIKHHGGSKFFGAMQLGPDGKIYIARKRRTNIDVIHNPDMPGDLCNYEEGVINVGGTSQLGLPAAYSKKCTDARFRVSRHFLPEGESLQFYDISPGEILDRTWNFPGGIPETSAEKEPVVMYPDSGVYDVSLTITNEYGTDTEYKQSYIYVGTTGMDNPVSMMEDVFIYPNPGNGIFNVATPHNDISLEVFSLQGMKIAEIAEATHNTKVDLSYLPKGMYLLRMKNRDAGLQKVIKMIIQ